jgi:hypothetical protein
VSFSIKNHTTSVGVAANNDACAASQPISIKNVTNASPIALAFSAVAEAIACSSFHLTWHLIIVFTASSDGVLFLLAAAPHLLQYNLHSPSNLAWHALHSNVYITQITAR